MRPKARCLSVAAIGAMMFVWVPAPAHAADYTMRIASGGPPPDVRHEAVYCMQEYLPRATNDRLEVEFFEGDMGDEREIMERLTLGTAEGYVGSTGPLQSVVNEPIASLYDVPYLFEDFDHLYRVANGEVGNQLHSAVEERGIRILDYVSLGTRAVYTRDTPITKPEDLEGLKLRTMENPIYVAMYKEFGAIPVPMAFSEIYTALQTGVLDGADGSLSSGLKWKHTEAVGHVTHLANHVVIASIIAVSEQWWQSLPEEMRDTVDQVTHACALLQQELDEALQDELHQNWVEAGIEFTEPDRDAMAEVAQRVYPMVYDTIGKDVIEQVQAMAGESDQ